MRAGESRVSKNKEPKKSKVYSYKEQEKACEQL